MKFIHTADWHLGNRMHDIDRAGEFRCFLEWLKTKLEEEQAEALVISGDIFDTVNPPVEARTMYHQFLASLLNTSCKNVIITGGNHDSGLLLDSEKEILSALNIHVVGSIANLEPCDMVFELFDQRGQTSAICAAVPYVRESELRKYCEQNDEDGTFSDKAYEVLYSEVLEKAKELRGSKNIPIIATGHLYAADLEGRFENCTKEIPTDDGCRVLDVVGNLGSIHAKIFPSEFDYVALGHIHYTTMVGKNPKIRYSGSPFVLGYDEAHLPRNVLTVTVQPATPPQVSAIQVPSFYKYRRISGNCATIKKELSKYLTEKQPQETYIELYYVKEDGVNLPEELSDIIEKIKENNVFVVSRRLQNSDAVFTGDNSWIEGTDVKNLEPEDIFKALLRSKVSVDGTGKTEEEIEKEREALVEKYLKYFVETYEKVQSGEYYDENN